MVVDPVLFCAFLTSFLSCFVVLFPFFIGQGGQLLPTSQVRDLGTLDTMVTLILKRYLKDEEDFRQGEITLRSWNQRRQHLTHRYIDLMKKRADLELKGGQNL